MKSRKKAAAAVNVRQSLDPTLTAPARADSWPLLTLCRHRPQNEGEPSEEGLELARSLAEMRPADMQDRMSTVGIER